MNKLYVGLGIAAISAALVVGFAAMPLGVERGTISAEEQNAPVGTCGYGVSSSFDASSAPKTRQGALEELFAVYEPLLDKLPEDSKFHPDLPVEQDRPKLEALVSTLRAALPDVARADREHPQPEVSVVVRGQDDQSRSGEFTIAYLPMSEGYRVTDYSVLGIPDPEGYCKEG